MDDQEQQRGSREQHPSAVSVRSGAGRLDEVLRVCVPEEHRLFSNCYQHGFRAGSWGERAAPRGQYDSEAAWAAYRAGHDAGWRLRKRALTGRRHRRVVREELPLFQ
jgi:hypothetical protein